MRRAGSVACAHPLALETFEFSGRFGLVQVGLDGLLLVVVGMATKRQIGTSGRCDDKAKRVHGGLGALPQDRSGLGGTLWKSG